MNDKKLSIIIPCFNEAKNIQIVLDKFLQIEKSFKTDIELVVIDGGSTDNSQTDLKSKFKELPDNYKLILKDSPGGYGKDIMEGLSHSTGELLCWTHADLQTDPEDVLKAFVRYREEQNKNDKVFIKGLRQNRRFMEAFFSFGMQIVSWFALKVYLSDINAQPKLFSRFFYENYLLKEPPNDFSLDLYALYQAKSNGFNIATVPVVFKNRIHGEAKGGGGSWKMRIKLIKRTFKYIFQLRKKLLIQ